jgi:hypothetical protein
MSMVVPHHEIVGVTVGESVTVGAKDVVGSSEGSGDGADVGTALTVGKVVGTVVGKVVGAGVDG